MSTTPPPESPRVDKDVRERAGDVENYKLARAEELRRLELQRTELEGMRTRTAQYLAFVGAATGFLVGNGLAATDRDGVFFSIAAVSTAVSALTVLSAISVFTGGWDVRKWRTSRWSFTLRSLTVLRAAEAELGRPSESQLNAYLARRYAEMTDRNAPVIARVRTQYLVFLALGGLQIIGWTTLLWVRA